MHCLPRLIPSCSTKTSDRCCAASPDSAPPAVSLLKARKQHPLHQWVNISLSSGTGVSSSCVRTYTASGIRLTTASILISLSGAGNSQNTRGDRSLLIKHSGNTFIVGHSGYCASSTSRDNGLTAPPSLRHTTSRSCITPSGKPDGRREHNLLFVLCRQHPVCQNHCPSQHHCNNRTIPVGASEPSSGQPVVFTRPMISVIVVIRKPLPAYRVGGMKSTGLSPVYDDMPDGSPQKTAQKILCA